MVAGERRRAMSTSRDQAEERRRDMEAERTDLDERLRSAADEEVAQPGPWPR